MRLVIGNWKFLHVQYATSTRSLYKNICSSGTANGTASCFVITKLNLSNAVETGMLRAVLRVLDVI